MHKYFDCAQGKEERKVGLRQEEEKRRKAWSLKQVNKKREGKKRRAKPRKVTTLNIFLIHKISKNSFEVYENLAMPK